MAIGNNIKNFRIRKGMTQKELAENLNVTFQAVSRWENDSVEPSIDMLRRLTEILECSLDDLFGSSTLKSEPEVVEKIVVQDYKPVLATCEKCNKPIFNSFDLFRFSSYESVRVGRTHKSIAKDHIYCKPCNEKRLYEEKQRKEIRRKEIQADFRKRRIKSFIIGGLIALLFLLVAIFSFVKKDYNSGVEILVSGIFAFTFSSCLILKNTFLADMWLEIVSWGFVKMPGVIFSLDIDGLIFLIVVKVFFFLLGIFFVLIAVVFATILALLLSVFVYPFSIVNNIRCKGIENLLAKKI